MGGYNQLQRGVEFHSCQNFFAEQMQYQRFAGVPLIFCNQTLSMLSKLGRQKLNDAVKKTCSSFSEIEME